MTLSWLNPYSFFLLALPFLWLFWVLLKSRRSGRKNIYAFSLPLSSLLVSSNYLKWVYRALSALAFIGISLLIVSAARPVLWQSSSHRTTEGIDIIITLDVSESMIADDLKPTRMVSAKKVITDFIDKRPDDRIGLVTFGGEAITKCPLTDDHAFLKAQVQDVQMRELKQGTAIGMGLSNAILRLKDSKAKTKVIVLITDGDSNVGDINPVTASQLARSMGIKIYSIGIGKDDRVLVPIYSYDVYGNQRGLIAQVPSYLNPELLREISHLTGARAYMARNNGMLIQILSEIDKLEKNQVLVQPKLKQIELYVRPAAIGISLLFLVWFLMETRYRRAKAYGI